MMKTLEIRVEITAEGKLVAPPLPDLKPGEYDAVLVLETPAPKRKMRPSEGLPIVHVDFWPEGMTLRREDEYGDDGR